MMKLWTPLIAMTLAATPVAAADLAPANHWADFADWQTFVLKPSLFPRQEIIISIPRRLNISFPRLSAFSTPRSPIKTAKPKARP